MSSFLTTCRGRPLERLGTHRQGFTLTELVVTVAVLAILAAVAFRSYASFLQERRLRQSAIEMLTVLQTARARAMKESQSSASLGAGYCALSMQVSNGAWTLATFPVDGDDPNNLCKDEPPLPNLDIAAASGVRDLVLSTNSNTVTFTHMGYLVSSNPREPTMIYLSASQTNAQYCLYLNMVSIRLGYRNAPTGSCTYNKS